MEVTLAHYSEIPGALARRAFERPAVVRALHVPCSVDAPLRERGEAVGALVADRAPFARDEVKPGLGFRVEGLGFRVEGLGFRV